jgi:hypothetical protein
MPVASHLKKVFNLPSGAKLTKLKAWSAKLWPVDIDAKWVVVGEMQKSAKVKSQPFQSAYDPV